MGRPRTPRPPKPSARQRVPVKTNGNQKHARQQSKPAPQKPKQTPQAAAEMMVEGLGTNAVTAAGYSKMLGELDLAECMALAA